MNDTLLKSVRQEYAQKGEVFSVEYENEKFWVKKARPTQSSLMHRLYYFLLRFSLIIPVQNKSKYQALEYETQKIKRFSTLGINTPKIVLQSKEFFVLSDCGKNVNSYIRKRDISKEKMYYYLDKTVAFLADIHNKNEFHGGAQARNFTYKNGVIATIDLEESFDTSVPLALLQYRDFLLFLLSLTKTRASFTLDYQYIIDTYVNQTQRKSVKNDLKKLANKVKVFTFLANTAPVKRFLGRDMKGFFTLMQQLQRLQVDE
jgi:tRNA A-37 threonylcarbamoyl transferase component Bud32